MEQPWKPRARSSFAWTVWLVTWASATCSLVQDCCGGQSFCSPLHKSLLNTWEAGAHTWWSLSPIEGGLRACSHKDSHWASPSVWGSKPGWQLVFSISEPPPTCCFLLLLLLVLLVEGLKKRILSSPHPNPPMGSFSPASPKFLLCPRWHMVSAFLITLWFCNSVIPELLMWGLSPSWLPASRTHLFLSVTSSFAYSPFKLWGLN